MYFKSNKLYILDQKNLPHKIRYVVCDNHKKVANAIKEMVIRGAPAIGCAAAYGFYMGFLTCKKKDARTMREHIKKIGDILAATRPTAVNVAWAVERMKMVANNVVGSGITEMREKLLSEANDIFNEDIAMNKKIGAFGAALFRKKSNVLTHCNAGALATAGYGTALGIIRRAFKDGKIKSVFVDETRPYLQGARLTAWELKEEKIPYFLITDNMPGYYMSRGEIDAVIVGADRITANGDAANKIGTYALAVLAKYHRIPFYVAAPSSSIDFSKKSGKEIPIEQRAPEEVVYIGGKSIAPVGAPALHPAFDVTPAKFITAIITEKGVFHRPYNFNITRLPAVDFIEL